jgi:hypothetical protein
MLFRLKVVAESLDSKNRVFQARGETPGATHEELEAIARDLEGGAVTRFYRGGGPRGRVVAARATEDGLWLKVRFLPRDTDVWRLVETGAINTVEIQTLDHGVDVFLKSVAATYPETVN